MTEQFPLTGGQQAMWFLDSVETNAANYNIAAAVRFQPRLEHSRVETAFRDIILRHDALRAAFFVADRVPRQRVRDDISFDVLCVDASGIDDAGLAACLREQSAEKFDLENDLPLRVVLYQRETESVLFICVHHVVADFHSLALIAEEFAQACSGLKPRDCSSVRYRDYCERSETWLTSAAAEQAASYWHQQLSGTLPRLELPGRSSSESVRSRGNRKRFQFDKVLLRQAEAVARSCGVTLFSVLLSAYFRFLGEICSQDDVIVGVPFLGRSRADEKFLVAYCVNPLPIRCRESRERSFDAICRETDAQVRAALARQRYPFSAIVRDLHVTRDTDTNPVFQTMFAWQKSQSREHRWLAALAVEDESFAFDVASLRMRAFPFATSAAQFGFSMTLAEVDGHISGTAQYDTDAFDDSDIDQLIDIYREILARETVVESNSACQKKTRPDRQDGIAHLLLQRFEAFNESVAIVEADRSWSYGALREQISRWGSALDASGYRAGDVVAVCLPRGAELVAACCAVLMNGGVLVPLDPDMPSARREEYLLRSNSQFLVSTRYMDVCSERIVNIDVTMADVQADMRLDAVKSGGGACVFTSGSTGRARCVLLDEYNLAYVATAAVKAYGLLPRDQVLQFTSPGFDVFLEEVLSALIAGAQLRFRKDASSIDIDVFENLLHEENITVVNLPTAFWHAWVSQMQGNDQVTLPHLRLVVVGGEAMQAEMLRKWQARMPDMQILNAYGPSETSVTALTADVTFADPASIPIGLPWPGTRVRVLNEDNRDVGSGCAGELFISGPGVAVGYRGDVLATRRRFVTLDDGNRWFRTGDLVRRSSDGELYFLGRVDRQLKVQGVRVEPDELEARVLELSNASRAIVDLIGARLCLFVESSKPLDIAALRVQLAEQLLPQMLPQEVHVFAKFPCTAGGKPDMEALHSHQRERRAAAGTVQADSSIRGQVILALNDALGRECDPDENFFEQGLDSLAAVTMAAELSRVCGWHVATRMVFEHPTVNALSAALAEYEVSVSTSEHDIAVQRVDLTAAQRRALHFRRLGNSGKEFAYRLEIEITGELDVGRFEDAWRRVLRRHDVFGAVIDDNGISPGKIDPFILFEVAGFNAIPDLEPSPRAWLRSALVPVDSQHYRFFVNVSPLVCDASSVQILFEEFEEIFAQPDVTLLPASSFFAAASAVTKLPDGNSLWKSRLANCTAAPQLAICKIGSTPNLNNRQVQLEIEGKTGEALRKLARNCGVSCAAVFLSAYAHLLQRYTSNGRPIAIGTAVTQRGRLETARGVGPFTNFAIVVPILESSQELEAALHAAQAELLDAVDHSNTDMEALLNAVGERGEFVPVECLFLYQSKLLRPLTLPGLSVRWRTLPELPLPALLCLETVQTECGFKLFLRFDTGVYEKHDIAAFGDALIRLLEEFAEQPKAVADALPCLPDSLHALQYGAAVSWSDRPELLHVTFSLMARIHPARTALISDGHHISYGALYATSNRIARVVYRQRQAIGARQPYVVGILMQKGWEQIVAALGILRGGGVFAPIDPELPETRVLELIEKAGIAAILTAPLYRSLYAWPAGLPVMTIDGRNVRAESPIPLRKRTVGVRPEDPAYIMFTSGTTGDPKGVMISHASALNTIYAMNDSLGVTSKDVFFGLSNLHFDLSIYDIFGAFAAGARLVLPDHERRVDPAHWETLLRENEVSIWNSVPALYSALLGHLSAPLTALRHALLSGDWIPLELPQRNTNLQPHTALYSLGGATEASIWSIIHSIEAKVSRNFIPYGLPLLNQHCFVLDPNGKPCPPDVPGELYIGGAGVALGYHANPLVSAAAFVTHSESGERLYRTGDAALLSSEGWFRILGRLDDRVKIDGRFVDLGVLERHIEADEQVAQATVQVRESNLRNQLVAFLVPADPGSGFDVASLRRRLGNSLPTWMVPRRFALLDAMPLTGNGKVDRRALADYTGKFLDAGSKQLTAPSTATEARLVELWQELLETDTVGVDDNFFELGGDSLLVVAMTAGIREKFGIEVPVQLLVTHQTVRLLGAALERIQHVDSVMPAASSDFLAGVATTVLEQEAQLDPDIHASAAPGGSAGQRVLLTGATGYLGARILHELLHSTDKEVFCLVRGEDAEERLRSVLAKLGHLSAMQESRLTAIRGDLGKPLLGLAENEYRLLSENVDEIIHCGARVNFMLPREVLREENAGGTQEVLRLAVRGRAKHIGYVSTVSVFPTIATASERIFGERDAIDHGMPIVGGYSQSKWIAERLVQQARERGVSVTVFRPGVIFGDTRYGDLPGDVLLVDFLKRCIQMQAVPELEVLVDIAPVDYVAAAVVALNGNRSAGNYHLTNPSPVHLREFVQVLRGLGISLEWKPPREWLDMAFTGNGESGMDALLALLQQAEEYGSIVFGRNLQRFDCSETVKALNDSKLVCPRIDEEFLRCFVKSLTED